MRGHLYCSTRCAREAGRVAWRNEARKRLSRPVSSRLAVVLVLVALGAPTLFALRVVSQLDRLNAPAPFARPRAAVSARIESVGADLGNMREAWWAPTIDVPMPDGSTASWLINGERTRPRCIMVNGHGQRFTNEAVNYNAFGAAFHVIDTTTFEYANHPAWMIPTVFK